VTTTGATLSWTAPSAGSNAIAGYDIYTSAGTLVGTTTATYCALTGLNANRTTPYGYYVEAVDTQGLASPASNIAQSGEKVTTTAESYDATIAAGGSVTIGFTGTYTNSDASPSSFSVLGTACS
jgi:hypothetical protein